MEHVLTLHHENFNTLSQREEYWTVHICTNCKALSHMWSLFIPTILWSMGFPDCSGDKGSTCNAGHSVSIPGLGRSPGRGGGNQFQYSCLENSMARGAWWATVHRVAKTWTRLSNQACTYLGYNHTRQKDLSRVCLWIKNKAKRMLSDYDLKFSLYSLRSAWVVRDSLNPPACECSMNWTINSSVCSPFPCQEWIWCMR